ncbi:hypothetical protein AAVH_13979 [Aphelenchoides avenae]|nr:hypothetical protein AAVH_13979 [Aphelenchus avenae]
MDDFGDEVTNYEKAKQPFFALAYIDLVKAAIKAQQEKEPAALADFKKDMTDILNYADEKKTLIMQYIGKHVAESGKPLTPPPEFEFTVNVFITWSTSTVNSDF